MPNTWILVADTEGARFFERRGPESVPRLVRDLPHHGRQAMAFALSEPSEELDERFARELGWLLARARTARSFHRLMLIAPPDLLARIRAELDPATRALVVGSPTLSRGERDTPSLRRELETAGVLAP